MQSKWIALATRIILFLWAGWWTIFGVVAGIGEGYDWRGVILHTTVPGLIFLAAAFLAMRWRRTGAVILILLGLSTFGFFWFAWTPEGFLLLAAPPLVAGLLLLSNRSHAGSYAPSPHRV